MLKIVIPEVTGWNSEKQEFEPLEESVELTLEHSLSSLSKWESKWHKPYLTDDDKTAEETIDYVRCMTLTENVDPNVYYRLTKENMQAIKSYINDPATATKFYNLMPDGNSKSNSKGPAQTSEIIYAAMFEAGIPLEFENRHLNQLLTQIKVCKERTSPPKNMSKKDRLAWQRAQHKKRSAKRGKK